MITRIKVFTAIFLAFFALSVGTTSVALAAPTEGSRGVACDTVDVISPDGGTCDDPAGSGINKSIKFALNMLSIVAGIIAVVMVIVSGFKYITAQGDSSKISSAKTALIYVIVGIVVVALAQFIVKFMLQRSTGVPPTPTPAVPATTQLPLDEQLWYVI